MNRTADRHVRAQGLAVIRPQRSRPARLLGLLIRLRAEIATAAALWLTWSWIACLLRGWAGEPAAGPDGEGQSWWVQHWPGVVAAVLVALVLGALLAVPSTRRYLLRRTLAVLTRHRLRAVLVECQVMNWTGNVPLLLWSRPTPIGERVWLLLRAGIDTVDIEKHLPYVASGCHARGARVRAARSVSSLVAVDVIRRDPLTRRPVRPLHAVPNQRKGA